MRIGMTGTTSVGKTTLVKALAELPQFSDYYIATERSKYLRDLGIPLNTDSTFPGQIIFLAERASEILRENLLTDRTIWDVCAFTLNAKSINHFEKKVFTDAAVLMKNHYDIVFYVDPEGVEVEDNGVRTTDLAYRDQIDATIKNLLKEYEPNHLVVIKGTTEERIRLVLETIDKYLYKTQTTTITL
jgi:deoxyadenosine/deoxycytidine kinase